MRCLAISRISETMPRKQVSDYDKGRMMEMYRNGKSYRKIAAEFQRHHSTVEKIVKRISETGIVTRKHGSGRKRCTESYVDDSIIREVKKRRTISSKEIKDLMDLSCCNQTIRNRIKEYGFYSGKQTKKILLSEAAMKARVDFAKKYLHWKISDWKKVLFCDESQFTYRYQNCDRVWKLRGEALQQQCIRETSRNYGKINVWACFSWNGVGKLTHINGK